MREQEDFFKHLRDNGFEPKTVFDIGVAWGTPPLYAAFPDSYYYLFEALPMFEKTIRNIVTKHRGEYQITALSDHKGKKTIYVGQTPIAQAGASLYHETERKAATPVEISFDRLDNMMAGKEFETPALVKVDAQGADVAIMRGGVETIRKCDVVILELGMFPFSNKENQIVNAISVMGSIGFTPYDFISLRPRPYDGALGQLDVAFVKEDGPFRKYPHWA